MVLLFHDAKWITVRVPAAGRSEVKESYFYKVRWNDFYVNLSGEKYEIKRFKVVKIALIQSHRNASVESGFSINSDILLENLHKIQQLHQDKFTTESIIMKVSCKLT